MLYLCFSYLFVVDISWIITSYFYLVLSYFIIYCTFWRVVLCSSLDFFLSSNRENVKVTCPAHCCYLFLLGQDDTSRGSSTLLSPDPQLERSSVTSLSLDFVHSPLPPGVSHDLDGSDLQELNNIGQQFKNHLAKCSPETTEGCETSCSSQVKTAFQAGS
jgi:hypothetical protein